MVMIIFKIIIFIVLVVLGFNITMDIYIKNYFPDSNEIYTFLKEGGIQKEINIFKILIIY